MSLGDPADRHGPPDSSALSRAEHSGRPALVFEDQTAKPPPFTFPAGMVAVSVGRSSSSDLVLDRDDSVSRLHARFEFARQAWNLVDDGFSTNGTFVNGERLRGRRELADGDSLRFGNTTAVFRWPQRDEIPARDASESALDHASPSVREDVRLSTTQRRVLMALCRPYLAGGGAATDEQIAAELVLSVGAVRGHLRVLLAKLGIDNPPAGDPRATLAEQAVAAGLVSKSEL